MPPAALLPPASSASSSTTILRFPSSTTAGSEEEDKRYDGKGTRTAAKQRLQHIRRKHSALAAFRFEHIEQVGDLRRIERLE
jgi:hypothetical protein